MPHKLNTALIFTGIYALMSVVMAAITYATAIYLDYEISSTATSVITLLVALQVTAERFARHAQESPNRTAAFGLAVLMTVGIVAVSMVSFLVPGTVTALAGVEPSLLIGIFAVMAVIYLLITWFAFPAFVRSALKRQRKEQDADTVSRF